MTRITRFLSALFFVLCCAHGARALGVEPPPPVQDDSLRIVVIGSSSAQGAGAKPGDSSWVRRYERHLRETFPATRVYNLAMGGYTTYHCLPTSAPVADGRPRPDSMRNITRALALRPSALLISLPTNDIADGFDTSEYRRNMDTLVALSARDSVPVWICSTQPRNLDSVKRILLSDTRGWILRQYAGRALDFWDSVATPEGFIRPELDFGDGVHVNNAGHAILFERLRAAAIPDTLQMLRPHRPPRGTVTRPSTLPRPESNTPQGGSRTQQR
ncbi:MAG: SGNH/GDSL hydrolase family protein [Ignavibacteriae bacterium]|nr:SGNH/GDSL hydrolase family protein [Ignavibacteriota bacterium]